MTRLKYTPSGRRHLGDLDPWDGRRVGQADPSRHVEPRDGREAKRIAGFQPQDDGLGEYRLNEEQTAKIASLPGFHPEPDRFFYYVEPYEPPEDSGLQASKEDQAKGR
jgi:hypothetical protein